jgi:molybdate transport system substrate-binding protein
MKITFLTILFTLSFLTLPSQAETTHIAVASNFTAPMKALISAFEKASPHKIKASYGSSGKIYAQIKHGAPFQIFFSADQEKPAALYKERITQSRPFTYSYGALALWSSQTEFRQQEIVRLKSGEFNKLSLANPKLAPYGIAALEVLEQMELVESTRNKWIKGENIAQTYQFVGTGNADLGFVALSQVINKTDYWLVPSNLHNAIRQDAVLLKSGQKNAAAKAFIKFIGSKQSQDIIESYGYSYDGFDDMNKPVLENNTGLGK